MMLRHVAKYDTGGTNTKLLMIGKYSITTIDRVFTGGLTYPPKMRN